MAYELQNMDKIPTNERGYLRQMVDNMSDILVSGGLIRGGMIESFFYDCINGQIVRSLMPRKSKEKYHNKLSDFYIDDRVGFRGIKKVQVQLDELAVFFRRITKYRPRRFNLGDIVRIRVPTTDKPMRNAWLRDHPELWGKAAKVKKINERSLSDLDYEGVEIQVGGKGNWFYVGSGDITKAIKRKRGGR